MLRLAMVLRAPDKHWMILTTRMRAFHHFSQTHVGDCSGGGVAGKGSAVSPLVQPFNILKHEFITPMLWALPFGAEAIHISR